MTTIRSLFLAPFGVCLLLSMVVAEEPIRIGSRRELMVDRHLIDKMTGVRLVLHHPTPREIVLVHDKPWEGSGTGYHSVFQDGGLYRMYYKGWQLTVNAKKLIQPHGLVTCYAESRDGIHWKKPKLGLVEFNGSKQNNIVLASAKIGKVNADAGHIAMFKDDNPRCSADAKYKAIIRSNGPKGLLPFKSPDGLHWSPMSERPVITKGAFDSQNLAFWDSVRGEYRAYFRYFTEGRRGILTATSKDFLAWTEPVPLVYPGAPKEQLYTNQIKPYHRAPHILIGFPDALHRSRLVEIDECITGSKTPSSAFEYFTTLRDRNHRRLVDDQPRWGHVSSLGGSVPATRPRTSKQLGLRQSVHCLAPRRDVVFHQRGSPRTVAVCLGQLLDRQEQPTPALHVAARWLRFGTGSVQRRGGRHQADHFLRRQTSVESGDIGSGWCPRGNSGSRRKADQRLCPERLSGNLWRRHQPDRHLAKRFRREVAGWQNRSTTVPAQGCRLVCVPVCERE